MESVNNDQSCQTPPTHAINIFLVHSIFSIDQLQWIGKIGTKIPLLFIPDIDILLIALRAIFPMKSIHTIVSNVQMTHCLILFHFIEFDSALIHMPCVFTLAIFFEELILWILKFDMLGV